MQESITDKRYQKLLLERGGRRFSEQEVTDILRQVLLQLDQIHKRGEAYGSISPTALSLEELEKVTLLPSQHSLPLSQESVKKDIYTLGATAITLLTGVKLESLKKPDGTWTWQDHRLVSDQFSAILNKAVLKGYSNISQILQDLDSETKVPSASLSTPVISSSLEINKVNRFSELWPRVWPFVGMTLALVILSLLGFGVYNSSRRSEFALPLSTASEEPQTSQVSPTNPTPQSNTVPDYRNPSEEPDEAGSSSTQTAQVVGDRTEPLKNVRAGKNIDEPVLFELPLGSRVQVLGSSYNQDQFLWYKIRIPETGQEGWIAHHLLKLD